MDIDVEDYDAALGEQAGDAERFVRGSLHEWLREYKDSDVPTYEFLDYAETVLEQAFREYGGAAEALACAKYDETAAALGIDVEPARPDGEAPEGQEDPSKIVWYHEWKAHDGEYGAFISAIASAAADHARFSAARTTIRNSEREDDFSKGMRFARVPTGRETCGFCLVLASRGFAYTSREAAGAGGVTGFNRFHFHCDCRVVAGDERAQVPGYDPGWYLKVYEDAQRTCGSGDTRDICREIETRAPQWVYNGEPGKVTQDEKAEPRPKEKQVAEWLSQRGFDVHFRATREAENKKTSDVFLGGPKGVAWEIKQPVGVGKRNISNQFNEAAGQSGKLILDVSLSPWELSDIEAEVERQLSIRTDFSEVLIVNSDYLKRYRKTK